MRYPALFIAVTLTVATPAMAQNRTADDEVTATSTDLVLRPNQQDRLWGQVFMVPIYFMTYITVHEGSHALMGLAVGREITGFEPYPHYVSYENDEGEPERWFVFGCTLSLNYDDEEPWRTALFSAAPYITDVLLFTMSDLLLEYVVDPHSAAAPFLLVGGMVTPLVNFAAGMNCMHDSCDWSSVSTSSGLPRGLLMMIGYSMFFTAAWRCLHQFRRIFLETRATAERRARAISVAPIMGSDMTGIGLSGAF